MPHITDISLLLGPDMLVWPGDPAVAVEPTARLAQGDPANVSELRLCLALRVAGGDGAPARVVLIGG